MRGFFLTPDPRWSALAVSVVVSHAAEGFITASSTMGSDIGGVSEAEKNDFFVVLTGGPSGLMRIRQVRGPAPERRSGTERPALAPMLSALRRCPRQIQGSRVRTRVGGPLRRGRAP